MRTIVELFIRWIHLTAGLVWFGGVFFSALISSPVLRRHLSLANSIQHTSAIHNRLRPIIRFSIHVLLITGAMSSFIVGLNSKMRFSQGYMIIFIAKLGMMGLMILFYSLHSSVFGRRLESVVANPMTDDVTLTKPIATIQKQTDLFAILTLLSGLAVFALSLMLKFF